MLQAGAVAHLSHVTATEVMVLINPLASTAIIIPNIALNDKQQLLIYFKIYTIYFALVNHTIPDKMLTRTLTFLLVVILMVVTKELKCKKLRSGNKKRVNLNRDTYIFFPTNGVRTFDIKPGKQVINDHINQEPQF